MDDSAESGRYHGAQMASLTYRITTLGCRVNHAESRELETILASRGLSPALDRNPADVEVVHSCSVTNTAAAKSRQALRRASRRLHPAHLKSSLCHAHGPTRNLPEPVVIVTGCYSSTNRDEAARLLGNPSQVIGHDSRDDTSMTLRFARRLDDWLGSHGRLNGVRMDVVGSSRGSQGGVHHLPVIVPGATSRGHIRAELKIQDGCDAHCTFCIIPTTRPTLRWKRVRDVVEEARRLVDLGHKEIVLTGIFIGAYGRKTALRRRQRSDHQPLADLIDAVAQVPGLGRLRVSSMEPGDVTEVLLDAMIANAPVVTPHLHLPLQSGSDSTLRRMNRQYRVGDYLEMIEMVNAALTTQDGLRPAITTDVICGFPGESNQDFEETVEIVRHVGYLHMHVFPYSARQGTAAARWTNAFVEARTMRQRVRHLLDMENDPIKGLSIRYRRQLLGRSVRVIVEQRDKSDPGLVTGRSDHYALIHLPSEHPRGTMVQARVTGVTATRTAGEIAEASIPLPIMQ